MVSLCGIGRHHERHGNYAKHSDADSTHAHNLMTGDLLGQSLPLTSPGYVSDAAELRDVRQSAIPADRQKDKKKPAAQTGRPVT